MAMKKPKKTPKRPTGSAPTKKVSMAKKATSAKKAKKGAKGTRPVPAKKKGTKAAPTKKAAASRRPSASAPVTPSPKPATLAPLRVPDVVVPDPQEVYDESINEFEADAARESETERGPDEEPGTSTVRQAEHPAPSSHRSGKRPRGIPARKPQDA